MQTLLHYVAGALIAGTIILLLATVQLRGQDGSIESVQYYGAKSSLTSFTQVIEQDFLNIGAGLLDIDNGVVLFDTLSATRRFQFRTRTDPAVPDSQLVTYTWKESGTVTLNNGVSIPTYQVERDINGVASGISMNTITRFRITPRSQFGLNPISHPDSLSKTQRIDVEIEAVSPLGKGEFMERIRWYKQFRPANLRRKYTGETLLPCTNCPT